MKNKQRYFTVSYAAYYSGRTFCFCDSQIICKGFLNRRWLSDELKGIAKCNSVVIISIQELSKEDYDQYTEGYEE
jgi:hypothetical protein